MKIDVEGGELGVLRGARSLLDRCKPIVAFECGVNSYGNYHKNPDEIFEIFTKLDFSIYSITGVKINDASQFMEATTAQNFWDYVAFHDADRKFATLLES
jgi:Methyltransferase FkbM domain